MGQTPHTLLSLRGYWKIPCGGNTPSGYAYGAAAQRRGMEGYSSFNPWPAGHCPKGSIFSAEKITEYGQLSGGRKRPDGVRWEQKTKLPLLPPPPEPIPRGRTRNRSAETTVDRTARDKQGGGLDCKP